MRPNVHIILSSINAKKGRFLQKDQLTISPHYLRRFHQFHDNLHSWSLLQCLHQRNVKSANRKYACFLLNITSQSAKNFERYKYVWQDADLRVAVDGSANYLAEKRLVQTADVICGDFDSIDAKLLESLRCPTKASKLQFLRDNRDRSSRLTLPQVIETQNQSQTDFTKSLRVAAEIRPDISFFIGLYDTDGSRIDHLFGLVNTLHLFKKNVVIVNVRSNTISWILWPGRHSIKKLHGKEMCSLVPFSGPAELTTEGLVYDLSPNVSLHFGGKISTSNICLEEANAISIDTNHEILWSIDLCT